MRRSRGVMDMRIRRLLVCLAAAPICLAAVAMAATQGLTVARWGRRTPPGFAGALCHWSGRSLRLLTVSGAAVTRRAVGAIRSPVYPCPTRRSYAAATAAAGSSGSSKYGSPHRSHSAWSQRLNSTSPATNARASASV
jgi:hypothetical protein